MYKFKTVRVTTSEALESLNTLYEDGWEYWESTSLQTTIGDKYQSCVYFTLRRPKTATVVEARLPEEYIS